jgi:hypothetical protein
MIDEGEEAYGLDDEPPDWAADDEHGVPDDDALDEDEPAPVLDGSIQ